MARVALDTSVVVEYVDERGELHEQAEAVFEAIIAGRLEAVVPHPVLAETYYVAARIYEALGLEGAEERAAELVEWLYRLPTVAVRGVDLELALETGAAKLKYGMALTDCFVLAAAGVYGGKALFKKREREMLERAEELEREYPVVFLEDYA